MIAGAKKIARKPLTDDLSVDIYKHVVPTTPPKAAWTLVTDGLSKLGNAEITMTILQEPGEADDIVPPDALTFLKLLPGLVKQKKFLRPGERTALSGHDFLGPLFKGLLYIPAESYGGVELPQGALAAVPLTAEELRVWEMCGPSRVMARLAKAGRYYPYLTWCDRKRESVFTQSELALIAKSSITQSAHLLSFESGILREKDRCIVVLTKDAARKLSKDLESIPAGAAIMVSLGVPISANALMVWSPPGASEIDAVGPAGSDATKLAGTFLELLPGLKENELHMVEDGFALMLTTPKWLELKKSLEQGKDFDLPLTGKSSPNFQVRYTK